MVICSTCTICTEYFDEDKPVATCGCGHTFHEECINRWVRTSSTCPKCRRNTTLRMVIRLFFEKPNEDEKELDPTKLKNKLDNVSAELTRRDQEKTAFDAERTGLQLQTKTLQKQLKSVATKLTNEQITTDTLKKQLSLLSLQMEEAKAAKKEAKRLREKLQLLERFELVLSGNSDAVEDMLNECGDGPKAARELATYCVSLKREFQNGKESKRKLKDDNEKLRKETTTKGKKLMEKSLEVDRLEKCVKNMEDDLSQVEKEKASLREKIKALQRTLNSPNANKSAISRLIMESPAPSLLNRTHLSADESIDLDEVPEDPGHPSTPTWPPPEPSPSRQAKSDCREFNVPFIKTTSAANKRKRLKEEEDAVVMSTICHSSLFNSKRPLQENKSIMKKGYDGMGGHQKFLKSTLFQKPTARNVIKPNRKKVLGKSTPPLPTMHTFLQ